MTTIDTPFRQDVADWVLRLPVAAAFGLSFVELACGRAVARLPWRAEHSHTPGAFQANPIAALADFTGVAAGLTLLPPGSGAATADYTAKFIAEARGEELIARARVLRSGATLTVTAIDVYAATTDTETMCCAALLTMRNVITRNPREAA
jgi:uncharacterized protein (TIGR00369 family)